MQQNIITLNTLNVNAKDSFDRISELTFNIKDHQLSDKLTNVLTTHFTNLSGIFTIMPSLNKLIAQYKALSQEGVIYIDKLFYLLVFVEEAISYAQVTAIQEGELVSF